MAAAEAQVSPVGFDRLYGLELVELDAQRGLAKVSVRDQLRRPDGAVHGGVYASIADGLATIATEQALNGKPASALATQTNLLRPIIEGTIHAGAIARHRGRTTWVWEVEMTDDAGELCAVCRVTIAIGDPPRG